MKRKMLCIAAVMLCFPQAAYAAESASTRYKYSFETGADIEYAKHTPTDQMGRYLRWAGAHTADAAAFAVLLRYSRSTYLQGTPSLESLA